MKFPNLNMEISWRTKIMVKFMGGRICLCFFEMFIHGDMNLRNP